MLISSLYHYRRVLTLLFLACRKHPTRTRFHGCRHVAENIALQAEFCNLVTVPLYSSEQLFFTLHGNTMLEGATLMW